MITPYCLAAQAALFPHDVMGSLLLFSLTTHLVMLQRLLRFIHSSRSVARNSTGDRGCFVFALLARFVNACVVRSRVFIEGLPSQG